MTISAEKNQAAKTAMGQYHAAVAQLLERCQQQKISRRWHVHVSYLRELLNKIDFDQIAEVLREDGCAACTLENWRILDSFCYALATWFDQAYPKKSQQSSEEAEDDDADQLFKHLKQPTYLCIQWIRSLNYKASLVEVDTHFADFEWGVKKFTEQLNAVAQQGNDSAVTVSKSFNNDPANNIPSKENGWSIVSWSLASKVTGVLLAGAIVTLVVGALLMAFSPSAEVATNVLGIIAAVLLLVAPLVKFGGECIEAIRSPELNV